MNLSNPDLKSLAIQKPGINMLGTHVLLELHDCNVKKLDDITFVESTLSQAAIVAGANVVSQHFHRFEPHGISGVVVISTSHIAIHSWPEFGFAAVDIFTCGQEMNNELAVSHIVTEFESANWQLSQLPRGELKGFQFPNNDDVKPVLKTRMDLQEEMHIDLGTPQLAYEDAGLHEHNITLYGLSVRKEKANGDKPASLWVSERDYNGEQHHYCVKNIVATGISEYQTYAVVDTYCYGRMLFLDGCSQSAERDEHVYHECLVQPAMLIHPDPKKVLVIGAGEGATAREILYHPGVKQVDLVDLDEEVVNMCIKHLPSFHQGSFHHPKVTLFFEDGYAFVEKCSTFYDVIIIDVVDSLEDGPAQKLYTEQFYNMLKRNCLAEQGILVVQSMEVNELELRDHWKVHHELKQSFKHVNSYSTFVGSFWSQWGYNIAGDAFSYNDVGAHVINQRILDRGIQERLDYFDGEMFVASLNMSKRLRAQSEKYSYYPPNKTIESKKRDVEFRTAGAIAHTPVNQAVNHEHFRPELEAVCDSLSG